MTEVLAQEEIDQLLTAINAGESAPEDFRPATETRRIKIYDFKRPDKLSKDQIRTLTIMHDTFARLTITSLSAQLRSIVHVHVASVDQLKYEEFTRSIPSPTTLAIINMDPLPGSALLEIDPAVTTSIIDRLFGGTGEGSKSQHELTEIEQSVMEGVIVRLLGNMREAWSTVIDLRPRLGQIDTNPQFASIVPPSDMVVLVTVETKIGDVEGMISVCIPYLTIEPILSKLSASYWYSSVRRAGSAENFNIIKEQLANVDVNLVAELGRIQLQVRDVLALQRGDIIHLHNVKIQDPMPLNVGTKTKFLYRPGVIGKKVAVQIVKKLADIDHDDVEELSAEGDDSL